jgi:hypothetical protein
MARQGQAWESAHANRVSIYAFPARLVKRILDNLTLKNKPAIK